MPRRKPGEEFLPREERFIQEYPIDFNGQKAAERAGYGVKRAAQSAKMLLDKPHVQRALRERCRLLMQKAEVTIDQLVDEFQCLGFSDIRDYLSWDHEGIHLRPSDELTNRQSRAILEVMEVQNERGRNMRFKLHDKKGALDSLARYFDLFHDQENADKIGKGLSALLETMKRSSQ